MYNYQNEKLIKGAVQAFTDKSITQKNASSASIQSLQAYILSYLIETLEQNTPKHDLGNAKVEQVKKLIRTMYSNPSLSIPKLASLVECNPDYLSNLYSTETGEHLSVYIRRIRLEAAKQQLRTTSLTISEIAWACGFENPSYFSNQYKKHYHHTPREEREIPERQITPK